MGIEQNTTEGSGTIEVCPKCNRITGCENFCNQCGYETSSKCDKNFMKNPGATREEITCDDCKEKEEKNKPAGDYSI